MNDFKLWFETEEPTMTLYRGDPADYGTHSLDKASTESLFGQGIYLTNNKRIAGDYTTKGSSDDIVFRFSGTNPSKSKVIDYYIYRLAQYIDENGKDLFFAEALPGFTDNPIRIKRLEFAKQKWEEMSKTHEVRINIDGTAVIRKKQGKQTITTYEVPLSIINKMLNAEKEIDDDIIYALCAAMRAAADYNCRELKQMAKENEDGFKPTFREIYRQLPAPYVINSKFQRTLRKQLKIQGYTGIEYAGGVTLGGGVKHRAFVIWDEQGLKKMRS